MPPPMSGLGAAAQPKKEPLKFQKLGGHEQAVMATSGDALATKVYAAKLGYFNDPYV